MNAFDDGLGRTVRARVSRLTPPGAYLALGDDAQAHAEAFLLPRGEVPEGTLVGDELEVFLYLDSEDRPTATLRKPKLQLGDVVFLEVVDVASIGAFVDWGLTKQLLVPHAEQTRPVMIGERHPFALYVDRSGRLAATMRIRELLTQRPPFQRGEWVEGEAWRKEPDLGVFVILDRHALGLLPETEPHALERGERARFRVANVLPDGKVELTLRREAHEEAEDDVKKVLEALARPGAPPLGDRASPETIASAVGISKKAFKRAVGHLLKEGRVAVDARGDLRVVPAGEARAAGSPGPRPGAGRPRAAGPRRR